MLEPSSCGKLYLFIAGTFELGTFRFGNRSDLGHKALASIILNTKFEQNDKRSSDQKITNYEVVSPYKTFVVKT